MRDIRFRLWCKEKEEMMEIRKMAFEDNKVWCISCVDHDSDFEYFPEDDDHVLMQYTGLKDKNDREIYEGDIVSLRNEFSNWKGSVVFDEGAFKLAIKHSWANSLSYFSKTDVFEDMGARTVLNNVYEVIGNIYENPELLGDAK